VNIVSLLEMVASASGETVALSSEGAHLTYDELFGLAGRAATLIADAGATHVAFVGQSGIEFPVALFAAAWAGVPFLPLNYRLADEQLQPLLAAHPGSLVVADETASERNLQADVTIVERGAWLAAARTASSTPRWVDDADAIAVLLYTSGTTAAPKAVVLRHRHLTSYVLGTVEFMAAEPDDAALVAVPPYHVAGVATVLSNVFANRRIVYLPQFTATAWLDAARAEQVTQAMVVPTMLARIVEELDARGAAAPKRLRSLSYGGAKTDRRVLERALALFPDTDFVNAYGLTETSSTIAVLGPEDHRKARDGDRSAIARLDSAGRILPTVEVRVVDPDGAPVAPGEVGEIAVRGDQISGEYLGAAPSAGDGWFATRDLGWLDDEGYLFIQGRSDDTIIRGGENIAPAEIEAVMREHADVADVAVVGVPDPEWGERIAAVVVPRGDALDVGELRSWARSRLRGSKTPDEIRLVAELPYSETGKLLRRSVRAQLEPGARSAD
jgi:acyl-CoA synthetase (AMP-forming)/AMP-acid ligase II